MQSPWPLPIVALTPASCGAVRWRMQGAERLTVIVKATFALVHDRSAELAAPAELVRSDRLRDGRGSLEEACETAPYLPGAGVLVRGHAAAPAGTTATGLSVRVALFREDRWLLDKVLHVYGDWTREAPSPLPFSLMPLVYERAYGGPHVDANPVGVGGVGSGMALPNIVDPADPLRPAGLGPIARHWAPRRGLLARDRALDPTVPELDGSFDFRHFHAAPADQQIEPLRGDEWIFLQGLHPRCPWLRSRLPSARGLARLYRTGAGSDEGGQPIELVADTLTIDADRLLCSVIWRGNVGLPAGDAPARMRVVAGVEVPGQPLLWHSAAAGPPSSRPWPAAPGVAGDEPGAGRSPGIEGARRAGGDGGLAVAGIARPLAPIAIAEGAGAPAAPATEIPAGHWSVVTQQVTQLGAVPPLPFSQQLGAVPPLPFSQQKEAHWSAVTQQVPLLKSIPPLPFSQQKEAHWSAVTQQVPPLGAPPPLPFLPAPEPPPRPEPPPGSVPFAMPFARSGPHASPPELPPPVQPPLAGLDETHPVIDQPPSQQGQPAAATCDEGGAAVEQPPSQGQPAAATRDGAGAVAEQPSSPGQPAVATRDEAGAVAEQPSSPGRPAPAALDETGPVAEQPPRPAQPAPATTDEVNPAVETPSSPAVAAPALQPEPPALARAAAPAEAASPPDDLAPADAALPDAAPADAALPDAALPDAALPDAAPADAALPDAAPADAALPDAAPAEPPPPEIEARGLRATVLARLRSGQPLYDLELAGAELEGIDWSGASLERLNLAGATLARCNFASARLARTNLSGADLTDARLHAADLTRADLSRATLDGAQLCSAILNNADLTSARGSKASFEGASLDGADLRQARLTEAVFDRASLADINGSKADISRSSFAHANLAGAILRAAKLKEASLACANVDGADLREADLAGANVYGVKLANAKSGGAILRCLVEIAPTDEDINVSSQG
ncbi:DUF2169 domain-containing protein [Sorangium sp. So ce1182]|uniref:DUF2169 family type VI secretion system accessory protein n=1 Tax=Sorangium sp. So ce1182 TaxID=3133334 RepID=UPI003F609031